MTKFSFLLLITLCHHFILCQINNNEVKIDTFFVNNKDVIIELTDGDFICNLMYNSDSTTSDYYKIRGNDSLIYCIQYHNNILFKEGFLMRYKFNGIHKCWGMV